MKLHTDSDVHASIMKDTPGFGGFGGCGGLPLERVPQSRRRGTLRGIPAEVIPPDTAFKVIVITDISTGKISDCPV
jgi:hypothetical protein